MKLQNQFQSANQRISLLVNPFNIPPLLMPVWQALGQPKLSLIDNRWLCSVALSPKIAEALLVFLRSRSGKEDKFSRTMIDDYADTMRRGLWIENSDPLIVSQSGYFIQGNHRIKAIIQAGVTLKFIINLGVPDEAEKQLGRVYPWYRWQLMNEDANYVAVGVAGTALNLAVHTVGRSWTPDVQFWIDIHRHFLKLVFDTAVSKTRTGTTRAGTMLACVEGAVIDQEMHGNTNKIELFIKVMTGQQMEGCIWAGVQKDYLASRRGKSGTGSSSARLFDYHSTLYNLKRHLVDYPYELDSRGRRPDKESTTADWGGMSAGKDLSGHYGSFIYRRIAEIRELNAQIFNSVNIFENLIQMVVDDAQKEEIKLAQPRSN